MNFRAWVVGCVVAAVPLSAAGGFHPAAAQDAGRAVAGALSQSARRIAPLGSYRPVPFLGNPADLPPGDASKGYHWDRFRAQNGDFVWGEVPDRIKVARTVKDGVTYDVWSDLTVTPAAPDGK